ncbi:related to NUP170 - nuclear pore protein [Cephalotrichum gorgonifer]|uniref:Related to NUP170 - nuclear pore protein n=1 Tax=Cephalotrichum gorgonifer TaxID=2041049 RepID=A0AAE8MRS1_9PEZI|nr:related to NUP170 - nuclear pore protein [Cephalotrichum gorgonifer]
MAYPQPTPMRPLPGAFINTPAVARTMSQGEDPVRRRLFSDATPTNSAGPATTGGLTGAGGSTGALPTTRSPIEPLVKLPPVDQTSPMAKAAHTINRRLQYDEEYPDIDSYCRPGASSEYYIPEHDSTLVPFHKAQTYTIPNQVFDHINAGELQTSMGLFAELNHAWVVIDNSLFLWDYTQPDPELIGFEDQPHSIHAVVLVPPKPGIFVNTITHILVVATTSEIILLGVAAETTSKGTRSVQLYQTKMVLPIRGADVSLIAGSANGRIFFGGGNDTDVYELYYQQEEKWFSNRCGKINHTNPGWTSVVTLQSGLFSSKEPEHLEQIVIDDSRNLLYTLSSRSTIRTYHMEAPNKLTKLIEKEKNHCLRDITHMINFSPLLNDRIKIVSISPISAQEATKLHLMALTNSGCRLFLSATNAASYMIGTASNLAPQSMQVQFIKFPPSETAPGQRQSAVYSATGDAVTDTQSQSLVMSRIGVRYAPGYFLDFVAKDTNPSVDLLFVSAPETGRINATSHSSVLKYYENGNWIELGSRVEAVGLTTKPFAASKRPLGFGNELAVQFDEAPSEFAVLTNSGVHIIRRRRLVDLFAASLKASSGDEGAESTTRRFTQLYGRVETLATALAVACGHGGDTRPGGTRANDSATEGRARGIFVEFGGQPVLNDADGAPLSAESVTLSGRHDALALYLSRLIRMLWKFPVISVGVAPAGGVAVNSQVPTGKLVSVQDNLERLRKFLETNRTFIQGLSGASDLQRVTSKKEEVALQAEHQAMHGLERLMESISEGISFVLMLFDERVSDIYTRLDDDTRQGLRDLTYEKLFSSAPGKELAKVLVKAIVNRNIESGSNVETVADALRRRCGSFCSPDDVVIFKAQEQLKRASEQPLNSSIARTLLQESLSLFEKVAGNLSFANLEAATEEYMKMRYYAGAIRLCLGVAREKDRGNAALAWINDGRPGGDQRAAAYRERRACYDLVHRVLLRLDGEAGQEPDMVDGRLTLTATKRLEAHEVVNGSTDEVFHFDLYQWYIDQGWTDRILGVDSPHVVTFLERLARTDAGHANLLCRFYTHQREYFKAATVQFELAQSDFRIPIKDRIGLLSLAKTNANVSSPGVARQQQQGLNHSISGLLEVANIQDDVLERLRVDERIDPERLVEIEEVLDNKIQDLTELFNEYADQAGYYDICLLIYHAADYRNPTTIAETWASLIDQAHEDAVGAPEGSDAPLPYESVSVKVQNIAHRTACDTVIFPISTLLPEICRYACAQRQDASIGADPTWPVQLFLGVGVSHDVVVRVLEHVFDTQDYGFSVMARRTRLIELIAYVVDSWSKEVRRRGGGGGLGGGAKIGMGAGVVELLERCEAGLPAPPGGSNPGGMEVAELRRVIRTLRREVGSLVERMGGTMRFA